MRRSLLLPFLCIALVGVGCSSSDPQDVKHRSLFWKIVDPWGDLVSEIKIPSDFPLVVPPYPQSTVTSVAVKDQGDEHLSILTLSTSDDVKTVSAWYHDKALAAGWEVVAESVKETESSQALKKGNERLVIAGTWIDPQHQTNIAIVYTQPKTW